MHDLSREALHAYAASDARLARVLTERRWSTASRFVDRVHDRGDGTPAPGWPDDRDGDVGDPARHLSPVGRRPFPAVTRTAVLRQPVIQLRPAVA
jgi:hypothetical protein